MRAVIISISILMILASSCSCGDNKRSSKVSSTRDMCDKLYNLIDANESGAIPDSIFKTQADSLRIAIDFSAGDMTTIEWDSIKIYEAKLLDELILKKVDRDRERKAE